MRQSVNNGINWQHRLPEITQRKIFFEECKTTRIKSNETPTSPLSIYSDKRCLEDQCWDDTLVFHISPSAAHADSLDPPKKIVKFIFPVTLNDFTRSKVILWQRFGCRAQSNSRSFVTRAKNNKISPWSWTRSALVCKNLESEKNEWFSVWLFEKKFRFANLANELIFRSYLHRDKWSI